jgi:hypothetical protein
MMIVITTINELASPWERQAEVEVVEVVVKGMSPPRSSE